MVDFSRAPGTGEVTLLTLGTLTNVARALEAEPRLGPALRGVVCMGAGATHPRPLPDHWAPGALHRGGPEHNIRCDVAAARRVLRAGVPLRLVTMDATATTWLEGPGVERFRQATLPHVRIVGAMLEEWLRYRSRIFREPIAGLIAGGSRGLFVGLGAPDPPGAGSGLPEGRRGPAESSDLRVHPHLVETAALHGLHRRWVTRLEAPSDSR